jgi:hypothetical protein
MYASPAESDESTVAKSVDWHEAALRMFCVIKGSSCLPDLGLWNSDWNSAFEPSKAGQTDINKFWPHFNVIELDFAASVMVPGLA